ncbi:MAG: hypothetical protein Q7S92_04155 [Candidatus Diapherotrites archaeon]|nr:hypothetical protein [Candidatus Diapherotrites archaeon]
MNKKELTEALSQMEAQSKKRKFAQTVELMINLKGLDLGKPDSQIDLKINLPYSTGRQAGKTLLFAKTDEFANKAKGIFDKIIMEPDISSLKKESVQEILSYDVSLAEGQAILTVAKYLGQTLAPKGKMPKPVKDTQSNLKDYINSLMTAIRVSNKKGKTLPVMQVVVGKEGMPAEQIIDNVMAIYDRVVESLPAKRQNIKSLHIKKTMGPAIKLSA